MIHQILIICVCVFTLTTLSLKSQVNILHPNQQDTIIVGENIDIVWENETGNSVSVLYSNDSGKIWNTIVEDIYENTFKWKVPYLSNKSIQFKVVEKSKPEIRRYWENFLAHSQEIHSCNFSYDGKYYLTAGEDGYFRIWNIEKNEINAEFSRSLNRIYCAKFWNNEDTVIYTLGDSIFLWDRTGSTEFLFAFSGPASYIDVDVNAGLIVACSKGEEGQVVIYSIAQKKEIDRFYGKNIKDSYYRCRFSHDGEYVAFSGYNKIVNLYNIETRKLSYNVTEANVNVIWGLDFSFDDKEIVSAGLDGVIRRFDVATMNRIAVYNEIYGSQTRAVRYVDENNNIIAGNLLGSGSKDALFPAVGTFIYGDLNKYQFDIVNIGYQITDIDYCKEYFGVVGRDPRGVGKLTILKLVPANPAVSVSNSNVYYKFFVNIPNIKARYNEVVEFPLDFKHSYNIDSMPFTAIDMFSLIDFPSRILDFEATSHNTYDTDGFDFIYGFNIKNIFEKNYNKITARVLFGNTNYDIIPFRTCYSSNEMVLYDTENGSIEIISDCSENANQILVTDKTNLNIEYVDQNNISINSIIGDDDEYKLIISDVFGTVLHENIINKAGSYAFAVDKNKYANGVYLVWLFSNYISFNEKFILSK